MKKFFQFSALLLFIILLLPSALACVDVKLGKTEYFPSETFQAEITGEFARALDNSNIAFYQGSSEITLFFKRDQIAANKYIVSFQLPASPGNYKFSLKNALCIENKTTKTVNKDTLFVIKKPLSDKYKELQSKTSAWPSGDDGAFALMALSYDDASAKKGKDALIASARSGDCWPFADCSVKSTAFSLMALSKTNSALNKNWILDSQNNVKIGLWDLVVVSNSDKQCALTINNDTKILDIKSGNNTFNLNLSDVPEIDIAFDCDADSFVSHTYLGTVNKFSFQSGSLTLNNRKCFGVSYRSECSVDSTAYALWALSNINVNDALAAAWLDENSRTTVERAISFILTSNPNMKEWLVNNQAPKGYWSNDALALEGGESIDATVFAIEALKGQNDDSSLSAVENAKAWLSQKLSNSELSVREISLILSRIFTSEQIEPLISFDPALFKAKSGTNLTLKITNNGLTAVSGVLYFEGASLGTFNINKSSSQSFVVKAPQTSSTKFSFFSLEYKSLGANRSFSVPILLWPATITEAAIEQTVKENKIETSVLPAAIQFLEISVNETLETGTKIHVNIYNPSAQSVEVTVLPSWDMLSEGVIAVENDKFILNANSSMEVILNVGNKTGIFSGTLDAKASASSASIPVYLNILAKSGAVEVAKNCTARGGKFCKANETCSVNLTSTAEGPCCIGICNPKAAEQKKSSNVLIGVIILAVLVIVLVVFFLLKTRKKPKKGIGDELKKIEEHYMQTIGGQKGTSQ